MRRRKFITLLGGATAASPILWTLAARAQQGDRVRRIGMLIALAESDAEGQARVAAFRQALAELGWTEGRNIRIDYRWTAGDAERARVMAADLVGLEPDVLLGHGTQAVAALQRATRTIPIVFVQVIDPVAGGLVASLARPGGNITGFTTFEHAIAGKWLQLLKEVAPRVSRLAVLRDPTVTAVAGHVDAIEAAAPSFGVKVHPLPVRAAAEIERAVDAFAPESNAGMIVLPSPLATGQRDLIIALAARHRLPTVYSLRFFAARGGLMSYGVDNIEIWRRGASYVSRILNGEKPADLPVMQPTKLELVINLKTARALGLTVPRHVLAGANTVIE